MYKCILLIVMLGVNIPAGIQSKVPAGLQELLGRFETDTMLEFGIHFLKGSFIDRSADNNSIKVGLPIEFFDIDIDKLDSLSEKAPVSSYVVQRNCWMVPVYVKERCVGNLICYINKKDRKWVIGEADCCATTDGWAMVRKVWPENKGADPVIVRLDDLWLHFPGINDYNLTRFPYVQSDKPLAVEADFTNPGHGSSKILDSLKIRLEKIEKSMQKSTFF